MLCGSLGGWGVWGENEHRCIYGCVTLLCTSNYRNIANWLYSNIELEVQKERERRWLLQIKSLRDVTASVKTGPSLDSYLGYLRNRYLPW